VSKAPFEEVVEAIREVLGDATVGFKVHDPGRHELADAAQQVAWIHLGGLYEPTDDTGGVPNTLGTQAIEATFEDRMAIEAHVTASSYADAISLKDRLVAAARTFGTAVVPGGYVVDAQRVMHGGSCTVVQRFEISVRVPKSDGVVELTTITSQSHRAFNQGTEQID